MTRRRIDLCCVQFYDEILRCCWNVVDKEKITERVESRHGSKESYLGAKRNVRSEMFLVKKLQEKYFNKRTTRCSVVANEKLVLKSGF